ncbi:neuroguidin, partial [Carica papaya]|uniref:neuroguidin n=1 Tax=Carica papaya TaxID=3649 RepID=UPI000B8CAF84
QSTYNTFAKSLSRWLCFGVKANNYPTADGISYLEAKHLLLLSYCQSLVYYLLQKAKGLSIEGHPVVSSLVEIRLFLEKIRPIDKKLQYQIQKLTRVSTTEKPGLSEKDPEVSKKSEDLLKYRPNPDMLVSKTDSIPEDGTYRPPKFAPVFMEDDKISKQERNALRREKEILKQATQSRYMKEILNEYEGRPEEVRDFVGAESRELDKFRAEWEERERQEEELFTRVPRTREERKREKHLKKSRNGLAGLTEDFSDIKFLSTGDDADERTTGFRSSRNGIGNLKKRKRKH